MPRMPKYAAPKTDTKIANIIGARNDTARPVVAYRPKTSPSRPGGMIRARNVRDADCAGPTNRHRARPAVQKTIWPPSCRKNTSSPEMIRPIRAATMTGFAPSLSSSAPTAIVETPATTLAAIAKMMTSPAEKPKTDAASTPPNVKTPASPSRKTALASRNQTVWRDSRHSFAMSRPEARVRGEEADALALDARAAVLGHGEQDGNGEQAEPERGDQHRDADGQAVLIGDAEEPLDEAEVDDQQQHDAADVAHAPAEAAHLADRARSRDLRQHRVVVDAGELEEHVAGGDQEQPEPQERRVGLHEEHRRGRGHDDVGVDGEPQLAACPRCRTADR